MKNEDWRARLTQAAEASGKSMRKISQDSGSGPGYLFTILKEGREPSLDKLLAICDAIPTDPAYILLGIEAKPMDIEILKALHENPKARSGILAILGIE